MHTANPRVVGRRRSLVLGTALTLALALSACTSGQAETPTGSPSGATKSGPITITFLQKQGDQQYFVDEANGAKAAAKELGNVTVKVVDLGTDAAKAISQVDLAVSQKTDGIVIVVPDQKIGPQVISAAKDAGIPLMAADDTISDASGAAAPFAGFDGTAMGNLVGKEAAALYLKSGWTAADTRVISAYKQDLATCKDRTTGAADAFTKALGGKEGPKVIDIGTDNSATDAQNKAGAVITGNSNVKHWVVWGCNDESETGVVTALQNSGVVAENINGVGLGAYLTCKDWNAGQTTGNKSSLFISGIEVGKAALTSIVALIRNGTPLPAKSIAKTAIVNSTNWKEAGVICT
ncbi:substrate-binding domain-containing protein [Arthrobacter sp. FW306-04-A]|uniref:substrate-binding domain-containing protein n=1 Tax=Arthrobacter sp. FW306-04-A TaxID=2879619 RepID=UPI0037BE618F|nr:substrate-binding domain-containing protein [Arthrobacter sp. FW306-04-A]